MPSRPMPENLGRYILDRRIAVGGMAEVFLARQSGPEGFERACVIKRMLPQFSGDSTFVRMFLDEARLAAQLTHSNIAQIYDFGAENGDYYLAMEYVPGATLKDALQAQMAAARFIPFRVAAKIISDSARALDYAHSARDGNGRTLHLIHRDVSPHNILLSRTGQVKLIDFGIAKALSANSHTNVGTIKGKYAYMSPEQVMGRDLDRRTDIYSLGLVFYELLTNTRAIQGDTTTAMAAAAARPQFVPLVEARPDAPAPLVDACMKALKPARDGRYATAGELSADLERFLVSEHITVSDDDVASLLPEEARFQPPPEPTAVDIPSRAAPTRPMRQTQPTAPAPVVAGAPFEPTLLRKEASAEGSDALIRSAIRPSATRRGVLIALIAAVAGGGGAVWYTQWHSAQPVAHVPPPVALMPTTVPAPTLTPPPIPPPVAPEPPKVATPQEPSHPHRAPPAQGTLVVSAQPAAQVWLDGRAAGTAPLRLSVAPGEHKLTFKNAELGIDQTRQVRVAAGEQREEALKVGKGSVDFRALPYAEVFLGEKKLGVTPFKPVDLWEGHYRFRFANGETGKSETRDVDVAAGKLLTVRVDLRGE